MRPAARHLMSGNLQYILSRPSTHLTPSLSLPKAIVHALHGGETRDGLFGGRTHGAFLTRDTHFNGRDGSGGEDLRIGVDGNDEAMRRADVLNDALILGVEERADERIQSSQGMERDHSRQRTGDAYNRLDTGLRDDGTGDAAGARLDSKIPFSDFGEPPVDDCHAVENADVWADLVPGIPNGAQNSKQSAKECCRLCKDLGSTKCNLWTWSPDTKACFLKKGLTAYQPLDRRPGVRLTAGALWPEMPRYLDAIGVAGSTRTEGNSIGAGGVRGDRGSVVGASSRDPEPCLHTMITSNGQPYMNWQTRVFFQTWLSASNQKGSPLKHFTRVLHRTKDDELINEVPTVRIHPTHVECDGGCDYAVKDRARAIAEWSTMDDSRRCSHVLMAEADYVLVRSPPPSVLLEKGHSYGFLFGYIIPWHKDAMPASKKMAQFIFGTDESKWPNLESVPQSGNAPQVLHRDDLEVVAPVWANLVEFGETDQTIKNVFGWVRDMYAFDFAAAKVGLAVHYPPVPLNKLMVQPPADVSLGDGCLMHYTWSPILSDTNGKELWKFDKRSFRGGEGSTNFFTVLQEQPLPPAWDPNAGYKLQAGEVVTEEGLQLMRLMAETFNAGVRKLMKFPKGTGDAEDVRKIRGG